jgi:hypothetical protein
VSATDKKQQKPKTRQPWWKTPEKIAFLFETLFKPFETLILHDTRQRDVVGKLRQLDVGIIDQASKRVKSFVEVQKRKKKVGIEDLGSWDYKRKR